MDLFLFNESFLGPKFNKRVTLYVYQTSVSLSKVQNTKRE